MRKHNLKLTRLQSHRYGLRRIDADDSNRGNLALLMSCI